MHDVREEKRQINAAIATYKTIHSRSFSSASSRKQIATI